MAIVEGAAGSGKTTTLRPVADLYRERGYSVVATAVAWRAALELGSDLDADALCVDKLLAMAARGRAPVDGKTVVFVDEAGMLSSAHADRILDLARKQGREAGSGGGHGAAAAGDGGSGPQAGPRRGGLGAGWTRCAASGPTPRTRWSGSTERRGRTRAAGQRR